MPTMGIVAKDNSLHHAITIAVVFLLLAGLILSSVSAWNICTSACVEGHKYRLFGYSFETIGVLFFAASNVLFWVSFWVAPVRYVVKWLIAFAFGAEAYFLYVQKVVIGSWCPICVSIATCVAFIALLFLIEYLTALRKEINADRRNEVMKKALHAVASLGASCIGLVIALVGVSKVEPTFASVSAEEGKTHIFGDLSSPVTVYVFTDWFCTACRKIEPIFEKEFPEIARKARVVFIDVPIHENSLNFLPYNLSFMLNNKDQYIGLRHDLIALSEKDPTPTDAQIETLARKHGVEYKQLDYSYINLGQKYFKKITKKYGVDATPAIVIANLKNKKARKLSGYRQIADANLFHIVDIMKK